MSQLPQALKIVILPVSYASSTLIQVYLTSDINKGSKLSPEFSWPVYVIERAGVPTVSSTWCTSEVSEASLLMPSSLTGRNTTLSFHCHSMSLVALNIP